MTLAFTLGMSCGYRRTLWMMAGELAGVATVAVSVAVGVAQVVRWRPEALTWLTMLGALYLLYVGVGMWRSASGALEAQSGRASVSQGQVVVLGYNTAVLNPKGWAFLIAILPGFINEQQSLSYQLGLLVPIFLIFRLQLFHVFLSVHHHQYFFVLYGEYVYLINLYSILIKVLYYLLNALRFLELLWKSYFLFEN